MSDTISTQAAPSASGDPPQAAAGAEPVVLDARVFTGDLAQPVAFAVKAGRIHALGFTTFAWVAIGRAVTNRSVSGARALGEHNRRGGVEARSLFARGGDGFTDAEAEIGRIGPGNLAELARLERDGVSAPEQEITHVSRVLMGLDGRVAFAAGDGRLAPELPEILPARSPIEHEGGDHAAA